MSVSLPMSESTNSERAIPGVDYEVTLSPILQHDYVQRCEDRCRGEIPGIDADTLERRYKYIRKFPKAVAVYLVSGMVQAYLLPWPEELEGLWGWNPETWLGTMEQVTLRIFDGDPV